MANLQVNQLRKHLNDNYVPYVESSDITETGNAREIHILSRALAAYAVVSLGNYEPSDVCSNITDEYNDNGIDLIYVDVDSKIMWVVQSKFVENGNKSIDLGDTHKFVQGIKDICNADYSRFGEKTKRLQTIIDTALEDANYRIYVVIATTGSSISADSFAVINPYIQENNEASDLMEFIDFNLAKGHEILRKGPSVSISKQLHIKNWGKIESPYKSIYGIVDATEISELWADYGTKLFSKNIRHFLGNTESNNAMKETLENTPELFKYFNNGVSILCQSYKKTAYGGNNTDLGIFECNGIQIVNGAQTVGTIGEFYKDSSEENHVAEVLVKIISLEGTPAEFSEKQTIANNTQNKIDKKDFISLSPIQQNLKNELRLDGITYHIKRGADIPVPDENNYTFEDAAVALATCQDDVSLSVLAKREVGKLWESQTSAPYTDLFNESLTSIRLKHVLKIYRYIQNKLKQLHNSETEPRNRRILVLGNLFITHLVMKQISRDTLENKSLNINEYTTNTVSALVEEFVSKTINVVNESYSNSNIPQLFRNFTKCRDIKSTIEGITTE